MTKPFFAILHVESKASYTGHERVTLNATSYEVIDSTLVFTLLDGNKQVFNWNKVLWFETEEHEGGATE